MGRADARKLKDAAADAVADGRWKRALEAYHSLARVEPHDGSWPQRAGEMCRRLGRPADAVAAFARACDAYAQSGFLLKAIACCKLVLELDPTHVTTQTRLAELYAARGLPPRGTVPGRLTVPRSPAGGASTAAALGPTPPASSTPGIRPLAELPIERRLAELPTPVGSPAVMELALDDAPVPMAASRGAPDESAPRTDELERTARAVLPRTPLFSALDEARLVRLIERCRLVRLERGAVLFRRGDPADALYVVVAGDVTVLAPREPDGSSVAEMIEVAHLGEGAFFGEIALVVDQPRAATVRAVGATELLAIDRAAVGALVDDSPEVARVLLRFVRERLLDTLVATSPLFAPFAGDERATLAGRFRFLEAPAGASLLTQGDRAPGLFVVLAGALDVSRDDTLLATLTAGDVFGEMSLLTRGPAMASIRSATRAFLLELPRADFQEVIMTHPQVLEFVHELADERRRANERARPGRDGRLRLI